MKNYVVYKISCLEGEERDILIAQLAAFGFDGFEEYDTYILANAEEGLIQQEDVEDWLHESSILFDKVTSPDQNWNALWESNFNPVVVGNFASVRAHFHKPVPAVQYEIIITPKMSFGTGHHATTRQMVECMQQIPFEGRRVIDFGTGTGILAILAAKMGAEKVEAIDNDIWSITNAEENVRVNEVEEKIKLHLSDRLDGILPADIVLANINKNILLHSMPDIKGVLKQNSYLILSGLLKDDAADIERSAGLQGLKKVKQTELNDWIALVFRPMEADVKLL